VQGDRMFLNPFTKREIILKRAMEEAEDIIGRAKFEGKVIGYY